MKIMLLSFLIVSATSFNATAATKLKLALNWKAEPQFGGFYAAELNGEFKKRGLEVAILEGGSGTPTVQMLGSNKVDFAIVSAEEIIVARDRGAQITALFATYQTSPQAIMTHAENNFKDLKEVFASEGILSMQSGLSYSQFLIKKYPDAKVKIVPYLGGITNFAKDPKYSQQCFFTSEPLLAMKSGLKIKTFLVSDAGFNPYTTVVAISSSRLKKDPKTAQAFVEAVRAGWQDYLNNPEPTNKHMAAINKAMDFETFTRSALVQKSLIETDETKQKNLGYMSLDRWQSLISQLKELKIIKKDLEAKDLFQNIN